MAAVVEFSADRAFDLVRSTTSTLISVLGAKTTVQVFSRRRLGAALAHRIHFGIPDGECLGLSPSDVSAIERRAELHWLVAELTLTFEVTRQGQVAFLARVAHSMQDLAVLAMPNLNGTGIGNSSETARREPRQVTPLGSWRRPNFRN